MTRRTVWIGAVCVVLASVVPAASAGEGPEGAQAPLAGALAHPALERLGARLARTPVAAPTAPPPSRFAPSGGRLLVERLLAALVEDPEQRAAVREVVQAVLAAYEAEAARSHVENDVAGALAFLLATSYSAAHGGVEVSDAATDALVRQLQGALDVPAMRRATDLEKQQLYELFSVLAVLALVHLQSALQQADAGEIAAVRRAGDEVLGAVLGVAPERVSLSAGAGLSIRPAGMAAGEASPPAIAASPVGAASAERLRYVVPAGWATEHKGDGTTWISRSDGDAFYGQSTCALVLFPAGLPVRDLPGALRAAWRSWIAGSFEGTAAPFGLRRRVGGANVAFAQEALRLRSNGAAFDVALYVVDLGGATATVGVLVQGDATLYAAPVEAFLASLRAQGAPSARALYDPAEIVGTWTWSSASYGSFVGPTGAYAGDASRAVGETLRLALDGTYALQIGGVGREGVVRSDEAGRYRIEGDRLVLLPDADESRARRRRLVGVGVDGGRDERVLLLHDEAYDLAPASIRFYGQRFVAR